MIVVVFDTETTGIPDSDLLDLDKQPEIIEFAAIKVDLNTQEEIERTDFLVKPKRTIPDEVIGITGITNDTVKDALPFESYVVDVKSMLENCDAVIAHNLSFDHQMVNLEMRRLNDELHWPRLICTVEQSMPYRGYRLSLSDLHQMLLNEKFSGAHRAINDVEALVRCVYAMHVEGYI